jgi:hypothetical protein
MTALKRLASIDAQLSGLREQVNRLDRGGVH